MATKVTLFGVNYSKLIDGAGFSKVDKRFVGQY